MSEGHVSDWLFEWYALNGGVGNTHAEREYSMLIAQGVTPGCVSEMWYELLGNLGYTGTVGDRKYAFWRDGGIIGPSLEFQFVHAVQADSIQTACQFDSTKDYRITAEIRLDSVPANAEVYTSQNPPAPYEFMRIPPSTPTSLTARKNGGPTQPVALDWNSLVGTGFQDYEEIYNATTKQVTVNYGGLSGNATDGSWTGALITLMEWFFNGRGVIRNVRVYDENDALLHYWPMDDGAASGGVIKDWGPAACDGTWANGAWEARS